VSHHFLYALQVGSVLNEVSRKGMAQCMRCNIRGYMSHFSVILDYFPEALTRQAIAVDIYEQRDLSLMPYHMRA
jgi:hypothetical protein